MRRLWLWGPVLAYMALIFYESSLTRAPLPGGMNDKLAHASGYALLGVLVARALAGGLFSPLDAAAAAGSIAITVLYAASDEWHQRFVPGRTADAADLVADALGAVAAVGLVWACGILWPRLTERRASIRDL